MKKRMLSAFLAVMMVLTMAPVAFAADTSVDSYAGLVDALNKAEDGDTITVSGTIAVEQPLTVTKTVTLTGGTLAAADDFAAPSTQLSECSLISMKTAGKTLTLENITLDANRKTLVVFSNAGKVVVNGAVITGGKTDSYVAGVYMTSASQFEMNSGSITDNEVGDAYKTDQYTQYAADLWIGANAKGALTAINGGTVGNIFVNSNAWSSENPGGFTMTDGIVENLYVEYDSGYGAAFTYDGGTINHLYISTVDGNGKKIEVTPVAGMVYIGGQTSEDDTAPIAKIGEKSYASLAAAVAAAKNGDTVTLLKDVDLSSAVEIDKNVDLDLGGHKLSRDGYSLDIYGDTTIKNGTIEVTKHGDVCAVWVNKTANLTVENDVTLIATDEAFALGFDPSCTAAEVTFKGTIAKGNGITVGGSIKDTSTNNKLTLDGAKIDATGCGLYLAGCAVTTVDSGSMIVGAETGIEIRAGKLIVNGAAITGNGVPTSVTPNGNGTTAVGAGIAVAQHTTRLPIDVTIADGTISGYTGLLESNPQNNPAEAIAKVNINVTGGRFAAINGGVNAVSSEDKRVIISGGVFSNKFDNAYCVAGRTVVANENVETKDVYPYTVGTIKAEGDNQVKTDTRDGNTKVTLGNKIAEKDKKAATDVGTSVTPTGLTDTAQITADDKAQALTELVKANKVILTEDGKIPEDTTVTVVKETYLDVTVTAYDTTNNTVSMEIVPKYNLIAVAKTGNIENRIPLQSAQDTTVKAATKVTVTIPAFAGQKVYINHADKNLYVAAAKADGKIEFTANSFGPFTFTLTNSSVVAEVNGNAYTSLQAAADAARNGDTITVVKNDKLDLTFKTTKSVKITNKTNGKITVKFNGTNKDVAKNTTETFSYTKPSGGSSSSRTTYKVVTSAVNNGGVNVSPSSAEKGTTITIILSPDKGYKLNKLTVTDDSGKSISITRKSDTVYTFVMPASQVKVSVSYVKDSSAAPTAGFSDVAANDWFADAVKYVFDKGMMNGTSATTFGPKLTTTRGMIVTVLYRMEKEPSTAAASFTDVGSGAYYTSAVAWANANGIVIGYGNGKFGPNNRITREQLAAILYRYAQYKGVDVGANSGMSLREYADAASVSAYAQPALQWAVNAGIVTGKPGNKLDSKGSATRAEVAAMLMRYCENIAK